MVYPPSNNYNSNYNRSAAAAAGGSNAMETNYDDRPISMYDNLNNMNTTGTATSTPKTSTLSTTTTQPTLNTPTTTSLLPSTKNSLNTNGAIYQQQQLQTTAPFTDISFKFNDNNNQQQSYPQQQQQQQQFASNGIRSLNQIQKPTTANTMQTTALYATPCKQPTATTQTKPLSTNTSALAANTSATTTPLTPQAQTTTSSAVYPLTSSSTSPSTAADNLQNRGQSSYNNNNNNNNNSITNNNNKNINNNRPLSQHSESELNVTNHSIAAVKAALNEAKSKFFGLSGYSPPASHQKQQQHQQHHDYDHPHSHSLNESQTHKLLPQSEQQQQPVQILKPQPKYQNIPENSAIYRQQLQQQQQQQQPPDLPPKPVEYQNLNKPTSTAPPPQHQQQQQPLATGATRKMPDSAVYNEISLNDIDGPASQHSQVSTVYMATTVPQNIKGNKIAGRHTPTRSSLRHSRMLVVSNKSYQEIQHPNPMGFQQPNLARWLLILEIILGILITCLSVWIFLLAPNTPIQDNTYWSGLGLILSGIVGLILIRYERIKRHKTREHCFIFLRMDSYILSLLAMLLCCVALIFAAIHYARLTASDTNCKSISVLNEHGSCVCTFNAPPPLNGTEPLANEELKDSESAEQIESNSYKVEYRDLSCQELCGPWISILGLSFILNTIGFIISLAYIVLLACCRNNSKRFYSTVHTSTF